MIYARMSAPFGTCKGLLESPFQAEQNEPKMTRIGAELMVQEVVEPE